MQREARREARRSGGSVPVLGVHRRRWREAAAGVGQEVPLGVEVGGVLGEAAARGPNAANGRRPSATRCKTGRPAAWSSGQSRGMVAMG